MTASRNISVLIVFLVFLYISCSTPKELDVNVPEESKFFDKISEYGIFTIRSGELIPNKKLVKYEVINSLFTDYAEKDRFVYTPEGTSAELNEKGYFDFPVGSMLVKNFAYSKDQLDIARIIETRLLIKDTKEWKAISYVWDKEQKEAKISRVGDAFPLQINHNQETLNFEYVVPNKNQCKNCHNYNEKIDPIGFKFSNLNTKILNSEGEINQLDFLESSGVVKLNDFADEINTMVAYTDVKNDIQQRALGYLDANCGHCHRPEGPGNTSGLFLQYDENRPNHLGFCKGPVAAGKGSGGRKFDILPGSADSSILYFRMSALDPGVMMPELGRSLVHKEGLALVKEWIDSIKYDCAVN